MKRKVIKQGIDGLTIYLPKKWTKKSGIHAGDEIELSEHDSELLLSNRETKKEPRTISLSLEGGKETKRRIPIVNAYRSGYNKISVQYAGDIKDIQRIAGELLVGFEVFRTAEHEFTLESVAEPDYSEFDKIVQKIFFILDDILKNLDEDIKSQVHQIQKYDNLLKRMLTKNMLSIPDPFSLWHFLSLITHAARDCIHFSEASDGKISTEDMKLQEKSIEMLSALQKMYLKKDASFLFRLHDMQDNSTKLGELLISKEKSVHAHYLMSICRDIYLASSPLYSVVSSSEEEKD